MHQNECQPSRTIWYNSRIVALEYELVQLTNYLVQYFVSCTQIYVVAILGPHFVEWGSEKQKLLLDVMYLILDEDQMFAKN